VSHPNIVEFERLVRAYLDGTASWDRVHKFAIELEVVNASDFPTHLRKPLDALHMAFLTADEKDDPQFRMDREEVSKLLADLERAQAQYPPI
jgi:hypothetical protein